MQAGHRPEGPLLQAADAADGEHPRIGTTSGKLWFAHPHSWPPECRRPAKFYRVSRFKEIRGFVRQVMWDGIDCHRACMLGWIAESVDFEPIRSFHLRPRGLSSAPPPDKHLTRPYWGA
jgi:hypothetical protein